jgi:hypothetical protein
VRIALAGPPPCSGKIRPGLGLTLTLGQGQSMGA